MLPVSNSKNTNMTTRLFLCNLKIYSGIFKDILDARKKFEGKKKYTGYWTCGRMVNINAGDTAYFMRVVDKKRGVFASGKVLEPPMNGVIKYQWLAVVDFDNPLLVSELLQQPDFKGTNLSVRGSGYRLADEYTSALNSAWQKYVLQFGYS